MKDKSPESPKSNISLENQLYACNTLRSQLSEAATKLKQQLAKSTQTNKDEIIIFHSPEIIGLANLLYKNQYAICDIIKERRKNGKATIELTKMLNQVYKQLETQAQLIETIPSLIRSNTNSHANIAQHDTPLFYAIKIDSYNKRFNHLKELLDPLRELQIKDLDLYILHLTSKKMMLSTSGSNKSFAEIKEITLAINELEDQRAHKIIAESKLKQNPLLLEAEISKYMNELQSLESAKESLEASDYLSIKHTLIARQTECEKVLAEMQKKHLPKQLDSEYNSKSTPQAETERPSHKIVQQDGQKNPALKLRRMNITSLQPAPNPPLSTAVPKKNTAPTPDIKRPHRQP